MLRKFFYLCLVVFLLGAVAIGVAGVWGYYYITRDLPNLKRIEDYQPPAVTSVYSNDGTLIAEFYEERRYPAKLSEVPAILRNAFLASEDANFYSHKGIDPVSIVRAFVKNLEAGGVKQGGSTITQQVVKNLLLSDEKRVRRKIKEAVLSYQLEQRFSKDDILEMYLNQIFFGNGAYGIKAAVKLYFHKALSEVTLAEAAMLAGLPKAPSRYSPLASLPRAKRRQRYVLDQMVKSGATTKEQADQAFAEELHVFPVDPNNIFYAPYYVGEIRRYFAEHWREINLDRDGLSVYTPLDLQADHFAAAALRNGLREVDKRRGWRGPLNHFSGPDAQAQFEKQYAALRNGAPQPDEVYPALVLGRNRNADGFALDVGGTKQNLSLKQSDWARRFLDSKDNVEGIRVEDRIRIGDVIEVALKNEPTNTKAEKPAELELMLDQTPEIEGALTLIDPHSGRVAAMVGGYSYQRSVFNRVTQSLRQPGSAFKPIVYLSAIDGFKYTPTTLVDDSPRTFRVGDELWTPANFDNKFLGYITLRSALEKSRNLVSADIITKIGIDPIIQYARKMGISSKLGHNLSLSLGSSEVTLLELTRAYGVFAAGGVLFDSVLVDRIVSRDGSLRYDYTNERLTKAHQVISPESAFIMANLMKGVVQSGTGVRVKPIGRPVAGKTGTSNDQMDTWFIGYTPQWVAGVWAGFDVKKEIGPKETGGKVAAPIWLYFMQPFLNYKDEASYAELERNAKAQAAQLGIQYIAPPKLEAADFTPPEGVEPFWIDKESGRAVDPGTPGAFLEYFVKGSGPQSAAEQEQVSSYLDSPDL